MELNCKHKRNPSIIKLIDHDQLHVKIAYLYKSRASWKYNNLSAEFEALMGKISNLVSFQSHALYQQERLQAQGRILGKDNEAVALGPSFSEIPCPPWDLCTIV